MAVGSCLTPAEAKAHELTLSLSLCDTFTLSSCSDDGG